MTSLTVLQLFKCLSDETRLTIVLLLKRTTELCVCELCEALDLPQSKISRHLAMLREHGILFDRRSGKWIHYRLSNNIPLWAGSIIEEAYKSQERRVEITAKRLKNSAVPATAKSMCK